MNDTPTIWFAAHHRSLPTPRLHGSLVLRLIQMNFCNNRHILESIGDVPPAEYEMMYYRQLEESAMVA